VKVKVYQLASELRISEKALLEWLSRSGYAQAQSHHWLSSQLARAARTHFVSLYHTNSYTSSSSMLTSFDTSTHLSDHSQMNQLPNHQQYKDQNKSSSSPAKKHNFQLLYQSEKKHNIQLQKHIQHLQDSKSTPTVLNTLNYQSNLSDNHQVVHQQLLNERTKDRQKIQELNQTQATLDQTCAELNLELNQMRSEVKQLHQQLHAQTQISHSLNQVSQQKKAWQARALELEEQVQSGQNLSIQLKELGLNSFEKQVLLFQTLLQTPESSAQLFSTIKTVDRDAIEKMVKHWVVYTCAHPLCNQTNKLQNYLSLRVDKSSKCEVCGGHEATRWFRRMAACCMRIHIKRFLMIGADEIHSQIRNLTEGRNIEFRLISETEQSSSARIQSRLESCDLLVLWGPKVIDPQISEAYYKMANIAQCSVLKISGDQADVSALSRQILYWISRSAGDALIY
jgi:hypothetical protein